MIRLAVKEDLPEILRMGRAFHKRSGLKFDLDEASIENLFQQLSPAPNAILVAEGSAGLHGMLGLMIYTHPLNRYVKMCQELMWWADPGHSVGIKLLKAAEAWALKHECQMVQMGCLDEVEGNAVADMYVRLGYLPQERYFVRYL